jgi:hypothetical protein
MKAKNKNGLFMFYYSSKNKKAKKCKYCKTIKQYTDMKLYSGDYYCNHKCIDLQKKKQLENCTEVPQSTDRIILSKNEEIIGVWEPHNVPVNDLDIVTYLRLKLRYENIPERSV